MKQTIVISVFFLILTQTAHSFNPYAKDSVANKDSNTNFKSNDTVNIFIETDIGFSSSSNDSRKEANSGTGTIGLKFEQGLFFGSVNFTVYSQNDEITTSDTLETKLFGTNLLLPQNSSGSISNFSARLGFKSFYHPDKSYYGLKKSILRRLGGYGYLYLNNTNWTKDSTTTPISVVSYGFNFTFDLINVELTGKDKNRIRLYAFYGVTTRGLGGDYSMDENKATRDYYLNTEKLLFIGQEYGARLEIGKFYGQVTSTVFSSGGNIDGFSGFQSVISMGVKADLNLMANNLLGKRPNKNKKMNSKKAKKKKGN